MDNNSTASSGGITIGIGIPSVVIGALIAFKKVGMTTMSYSDIIWFGVEVFLVCALVGFVIWFLLMCCVLFFQGFNK